MDARYPPIPPDHRLRDCPAQQVSVTWPAPIGRRLDELVALAREVGRDTNRKELLAALVLSSPVGPDELDGIVKQYRIATAEDALVRPEVVSDGNVYILPRYRPGPR